MPEDSLGGRNGNTTDVPLEEVDSPAYSATLNDKPAYFGVGGLEKHSVSTPGKTGKLYAYPGDKDWPVIPDGVPRPESEYLGSDEDITGDLVPQGEASEKHPSGTPEIDIPRIYVNIVTGAEDAAEAASPEEWVPYAFQYLNGKKVELEVPTQIGISYNGVPVGGALYIPKGSDFFKGIEVERDTAILMAPMPEKLLE